jgi:putative membrane protein
VVIFRSSSANYNDIAFLWGIIGAFLSHTYIIFSPDFFDDWLVFCTPLLGFGFLYALAQIPLFLSLGVTKARKQKNVEIMARALFQKGGISKTRYKTGVLIYCSLLEKSVYILPDSGAQLALPSEEWQNLSNQFQLIFSKNNPYEALLEQLHKSHIIFQRYAPRKSFKLNELPDDMEIDL